MSNDLSKRSRSELFSMLSEAEEHTKRLKEELFSRTPQLPRDALRLVLLHLPLRTRLFYRCVSQLWKRTVEEMTENVPLSPGDSDLFAQSSLEGLSCCALRSLDLSLLYAPLNPACLARTTTLVKLQLGHAGPVTIDLLKSLPRLRFLSGSLGPDVLSQLSELPELRHLRFSLPHQMSGFPPAPQVQGLDIELSWQLKANSGSIPLLFPNLTCIRMSFGQEIGMKFVAAIAALPLRELQLYLKTKQMRDTGLVRLVKEGPHLAKTLRIFTLGGGHSLGTAPIRHLTSLEELNLCTSSVEQVEDFVPASVQILRMPQQGMIQHGRLENFPNLRELQTYQVSVLSLLGRAITVLSLGQFSRENFADEAISSLAESLVSLRIGAAPVWLQRLTRLRHLRIEVPRPGLAEELIQLSQLQVLGFPCDIDDADIIKNLCRLTTLRFLLLSGTVQFEEQQATQFASLVHLETLAIRCRSQSDWTTSQLMGIARAAPSLTHLMLENVKSIPLHKLLHDPENRLERLSSTMYDLDSYFPFRTLPSGHTGRRFVVRDDEY